MQYLLTENSALKHRLAVYLLPEKLEKKIPNPSFHTFLGLDLLLELCNSLKLAPALLLR